LEKDNTLKVPGDVKNMTILDAQNITKTFMIGERNIHILEDVSLQVNEGEFLVISGDSGSGKTTLLSILSGLDHPSSGTITLAGTEITSLTEDQLAETRNAVIGFVFQAFHLVPSLNAFENITFPAELRGDPEAGEKAEKLLRRVGLWHRRTNFPSQLSGGEKQRVALCRALINRPRIIFADEPTGNLDSSNSGEIVQLLLEMQKEWNTTLIMATHSPEVSSLADRITRLHDGKIER